MMSDAMQTLRQIIEVGGDRKLELTLPDNVEPGPMEVVVMFQPVRTGLAYCLSAIEVSEIVWFPAKAS